MNDQKQIANFLDKYKTKNHSKLRSARCGELSGVLRSTGRGLIGFDADGKEIRDWSKQHQVATAAAKELDQLSDDQRRALFAALFPKIARHVESAWQMLHEMPYQNGWQNRPFRAPKLAEATRASRAQFLATLINLTDGYEQSITWFAEWGTQLLGGYWNRCLEIVFAAAIARGDTEGDAVFQIMLQAARGEHETAPMGRLVINTLLMSAREAGWQTIERMLLAAQRQEGLRQAILEAADLAHPEAFWRLVRLILDNNLVRFAATVRAVDVWFGLLWDSASASVVQGVLERLFEIHKDEKSLRAALQGDKADTAYLALCTLSFDDIENALAPARRLLHHAEADMRFASALLLGQLRLDVAKKCLIPALADTDLRIAMIAMQAFADGTFTKENPDSDIFDRIEPLFSSFPKRKTTLEPILWPWNRMTVDRAHVGSALVLNLGNRPIDRLLPYLHDMATDTRFQIATLINERSVASVKAREALLMLVGDASEYVRREALSGLSNSRIDPEEAEQLEALLTRKAGDLRRGVMAALLGSGDSQALECAERLLESKNVQQRLAGLEMVSTLVARKRSVRRGRVLVKGYAENRKKLTRGEETLLASVLDQAEEPLTLKDALGLMDPLQRAAIQPVRSRDFTFVTPATEACLNALDELFHVHREAPIEIEAFDDTRADTLVGLISHHFPHPQSNTPLEKDLGRLPLREIWQQWLVERPQETRDDDQLELWRAILLLDLNECSSRGVNREAKNKLGFTKLKKLQYKEAVAGVLPWLVRLAPVKGSATALVDLLETSYSLVSEEELKRKTSRGPWKEATWRSYDSAYTKCVGLVNLHRNLFADDWTSDLLARLWHLERWHSQPFVGSSSQPKAKRQDGERPSLELTTAAFEANAACDADIFDQLIGPRNSSNPYGGGFEDLSTLTRRKPGKILKNHPWLERFAAMCRDRVLEVELKRGDNPTAATSAARTLSSVHGIPWLIRILEAIGKDSLARGYTWSSEENKKAVFSHLLRATYPDDDDTPDMLRASAAEAKVKETSLVELAVFAPQWARLIEGALNWQGLEEAVWWIHAHTKDQDWSAGQELRAEWNGQMSQRTALSARDLVDGAVDVEWFHRVYARLKKARWQKLDAAAKYASAGAGHKRAQLFADSMLGVVKKRELIERIDGKRHQDAVRALGLLPLARGAARDRDVLDRYKRIQEYVRTSRQFGAQRRASERRAATIGQANLARTAGYRDPIRLQWAMEAQAVADLADGPIDLTIGDIQVSLAITDRADIELKIERSGRILKTAPAAIKKNKKFLDLRDRRKEIKKQAARIRPSLEEMMCRGEELDGGELTKLSSHPLIGPMLSRLVLVGADAIGYPDTRGTSLVDHTGDKHRLKTDDALRIAHPDDLFWSGQWHEWQRHCFAREIVQPFKQIFREYYPLTKAERSEKTQSLRYAGQQVNPRQALALLGSRHWATLPDEGVCKTFHELGITAHVEFQEPFFTPAEVDGLTLEVVRFTRRGEWKTLPLAEIPSRLFSEVMRDLDLIVSVAHRGGVDPEASASTIEMRSNLLRETLALVDVENVRIEKNHVLVDGKLANYTIHIGSAVTHQLPGGALFLIPVHSQHRGRTFLPFADDDPKTAEVISKTLLLARDGEIKDPNLLEQIRAASRHS